MSENYAQAFNDNGTTIIVYNGLTYRADNSNLDIIRLDQIVTASQAVIDNGTILIVYNGQAYRATSSSMKGPKGDKLTFSDLTPVDIAALQQPSRDMILQLTQLNNTVSQAETSRGIEEAKRVAQESARVTAEEERTQAYTEISTNADLWAVAEEDRKSSELDRVSNEQQRVINEQQREAQEAQRQTNTTQAINNANSATDLLNEYNNHRDKIIDGYWWTWNAEKNIYEETENRADGNILFATFDVDSFGDLIMTTPDAYDGANFELINNDLYVNII